MARSRPRLGARRPNITRQLDSNITTLASTSENGKTEIRWHSLHGTAWVSGVGIGWLPVKPG